MPTRSGIAYRILEPPEEAPKGALSYSDNFKVSRARAVDALTPQASRRPRPRSSAG